MMLEKLAAEEHNILLQFTGLPPQAGTKLWRDPRKSKKSHSNSPTDASNTSLHWNVLCIGICLSRKF